MSSADPGAGGLPPLGLGALGYGNSLTEPLGAQPGPEQDAQLSRLRQSQADWITALIGGWKTVVEVIDFYAERILNAAYLPTAEQPSARTHLYRSLGHAFAPNTAATTVLSYQVTDRGAGIEAIRRARRGGAGGGSTPPPVPAAPPPSPSELAAGSAVSVFGVPRRNLVSGTGPAVPAPAGPASPGAGTTVPAGSQVRGISDQGAPPPVFVTLADLDARPGLSGLRPRLAVSAGPPALTGATTQAELAGTATGLKAGDAVLITADDQDGAGGGQPASWVRTLTAVTPDAARKSTRIGWSEPLSAPAPGQAPVTLGPGAVYSFAASAPLVGASAQPWPSASASVRAAAFADAAQPVLGGVLRSADGGSTWTAEAVLPAAVTELTAVAAAGPVLLVGAGDAGALVSVAGAPLAPARLPGSHRVTCAGGSRPGLLVGTSDGLVFQSADDGRSWSRVTGGPPTRHDLQVVTHQLPGSPVHAILDTGQDDMLLAGTDTGLFLRHGPGWDPAGNATEAIFALLRVTPRLMVAGGAKGVKVLTGDSPEHLRVTARLPGTRVYALAATSAPSGPVVYAGTDDGVQRAADADLSHWQPVNGRGVGALPAGTTVTALAAAPGLLLAATAAGLYRSVDDGQQWQRCTAAGLFTVPVAAQALAGAAAPPSWLLEAFSARGIEFAADARLTTVTGGFELTDQSGVTYHLAAAAGGWSVALTNGLPAVTAVTADAGGVIACVSPVKPLADEWPGFLVAGSQLEVAGAFRAAVPGGRAAIVQQTAAPRSQPLDITAVEQDAASRFGRPAVQLTRLTVQQELPGGAFPRRSSTVWAGAARLTPYLPPPDNVTPVTGARITLSAPLDVPLPAGRLGSVTGKPLQLTVAPLGGAFQITPSGAVARGPAQADALDLCVTADGEVVVGTAEGVFIIAPSAAGPVLADQGWPGGAATAVAAPVPGVVLAATPHGVLRLVTGTAGWTDGGLGGLAVSALTAVSGRAVAATQGGAVFQATFLAAGTGTGPAAGTGTAQSAWSELPALPSAASALLIAGDRTYAATADGVLLLDPAGTSWQPAGAGGQAGSGAAAGPDGLSVAGAPAGVTSLVVDQAGLVWAGSPSGAASLSPASGEWRAEPDGTLASGVTALAVTPDGRLTAATPQGTWVRSADGGWQAAAEPGGRLTSLAYAADGTLWAAASAAVQILPDAAAAPVAVPLQTVFADLPVQAVDLVTLGQGGLPEAVSDAIEASGSRLDHAALTVRPAAAAGDAWLLIADASAYLVVSRDTSRGWRLCGYACPAVAAAAGPTAAAAGASGAEAVPVSIPAGGTGTIRALPETVIWLPAAADAAAAAETVTLDAPDPDDPLGVLRLSRPLGNVYDGATVQVNLNVVAAAHGMPLAAAIGSASPAQANQSFDLNVPVAVVASDPATGGPSASPLSSLAITVDGVPWTQAPTLLTAGKDDRVYAFDPGQDGSGIVRFGDGRHGARPSGPVVATYLQGGGAAGAVAEGTLIQPVDRPQLVQAVHNPQPARRPPQAPSDRTALARVRLLGRIVTLPDYRDRAEAYPGVASARVQLLGGGPREIVVTIAAAPGIDDADALAAGVAETLRSQATGDVPLRVLPATAVPVTLHLRIVADGAGAGDLRDCLGGLTARRPGDPLLASQVLAAADAVPGVTAAAIAGWGRDGAAQTRRTALPAQPACRSAAGRILTPAELLCIDGRSGRLLITTGEETADDGA